MKWVHWFMRDQDTSRILLETPNKIAEIAKPAKLWELVVADSHEAIPASQLVDSSLGVAEQVLVADDLEGSAEHAESDYMPTDAEDASEEPEPPVPCQGSFGGARTRLGGASW